jgi:hypothetical protein
MRKRLIEPQQEREGNVAVSLTKQGSRVARATIRSSFDEKHSKIWRESLVENISNITNS